MLNQIISQTLPYIPKKVVQWASKKYVAGETLDDAVKIVKALNEKGIFATVDVLGEFVSDRAQALSSTQESSFVLDAINQKDLQSGISVKLTSLGLDIDDEFCFENLKSLVTKAKKFNRFLRIDMENSPYTTRTLNLYKRLREEKIDNTGVVIQAYMRRSADDIRSFAPLNVPVRLCKGIYREDPSIAFKDRVEIQENYKKLLVMLFENNMHAAIATHDDVLIDFAREYIAKNTISKDRYEFQMLLGVRENTRDELVKEGHRVRIYVPFGKDWYGYSIRRLKENPEMAVAIAKAFVFGGLEPFEDVVELFNLIDTIRAETSDDIVIYTGYRENEIAALVAVLERIHKNIIIKFGRFVPDQKAHLDSVLGVNLSSPNQYAKKIS